MGYELKKVMGLYGVQTPSMARYAGVEKPADVAALGDTATAEQRAQYAKDKAAFDEQMRRYDIDQAAYKGYTDAYGRNIGLGNIYNQAQFGFAGQQPAFETLQAPVYSTAADAPAGGTGAGGFDYDAFAKANLPTWFRPDVYAKAVEGLQSGVNFGDYDITGRGRQGTLAINYGDFLIPTGFRDSRDIQRHADALRDMYNIYTTQQYAEGGEVQAYQQGGRQGDGITVRRIEDDPVLEGAAGAIDRVRAAERDVAPITIEDPFARENDLRALLESYAPQADYSGQLAEAEARRKAEFDAFANMIAGQANPEADKASKAEMYFRLAAAFGSPTKTGAFGENLALAAGEMADVSAARRKSLAERAARQADLQKLRYQMAGEEVSALRSAQAGETDAQRRLAETLLKESIAANRPQSQREILDMQIRLADLQQRERVLGQMSEPEMRMKSDLENSIARQETVLRQLNEAFQRNPNSFANNPLDRAQYTMLSMVGSNDDRVINTAMIDNLLSAQTLQSLKDTFGGSGITEKEMAALDALSGATSASREARAEIILRAYETAKQVVERQKQKLRQIEEGTYRQYNQAEGE